MKLLSATLCLSLYFLSAIAGPLSVFGGQHTLGDSGLPVNGDNPFEYCDEKAKQSPVITIERLDLSPNPPQKGQTLDIEAVGVVLEEIKEGAYADVSVYAGPFRIIHQKFDLCELVGNVDLKCPIQKGESTVKKTVDLPEEIPPVCVSSMHSLHDDFGRTDELLGHAQGSFKVVVNASTIDDHPITCLIANVKFQLSLMEL